MVDSLRTGSLVSGLDPTSQLAGVSIIGSERARAVVMLHGAMSNRHMWEGVVGHLGDEFRCVLVDLPGHGELINDDFRAEYATTRIGEVLDSIGEDEAALVGLSLGGYMAQAYTSEHPERVSGLAIVGATKPCTGSTGLMFRLTGYLMRLFSVRAERGFSDHLKSDVEPEIANAILEGGLSPIARRRAFGN